MARAPPLAWLDAEIKHVRRRRSSASARGHLAGEAATVDGRGASEGRVEKQSHPPEQVLFRRRREDRHPDVPEVLAVLDESLVALAALTALLDVGPLHD